MQAIRDIGSCSCDSTTQTAFHKSLNLRNNQQRGEEFGMTRKSRITSEISFERDGKQQSFLRLPHSIHRSAYGWIAIPIIVIKNGTGPTVLLTAGNHGDEYEGQLALMKLCRELEPQDVRGRIIMLPATNYPAVIAGLRTSPIDDLNLNRVFPGDADGRPTEAIAHYIESELLSIADFAIDLHSGGSSLMYLPSSLATLVEAARNASSICCPAWIHRLSGRRGPHPAGCCKTRRSPGNRHRVGWIGIGYRAVCGNRGTRSPSSAEISWQPA